MDSDHNAYIFNDADPDAVTNSLLSSVNNTPVFFLLKQRTFTYISKVSPELPGAVAVFFCPAPTLVLAPTPTLLYVIFTGP